MQLIPRAPVTVSHRFRDYVVFGITEFELIRNDYCKETCNVILIDSKN